MKFRPLILSGLILSLSPWVSAQNIDVEVTNLTHGIFFTPILISAHAADTALFEVGTAASVELQAMAEGGDLEGLVADLDGIGAVSVANPAAGLLAPASSTSAMGIDTGEFGNLSVVAMMLPTNDGFIGLDGWTIPETAGSYTIWLNAYDAGTEANDEQVTGGGAPGAPGIPANPGANGGTDGTGVTTMEANATVHVHRGNVGDTDATGGVSDVDSRIHRWLNPVAKVVVTVN
jgi:hypothetical protein